MRKTKEEEKRQGRKWLDGHFLSMSQTSVLKSLTIPAARKSASQPPTDGTFEAPRKTLRTDGKARSTLNEQKGEVVFASDWGQHILFMTVLWTRFLLQDISQSVLLATWTYRVYNIISNAISLPTLLPFFTIASCIF